jgi:hypothetical protein
MKAFGFAAHHPDLYEEVIPVPVGEPCLHCREPIAAADAGVAMPLITADPLPAVAVYHYECHLRMAVGSVKHQRGECGCASGDFSGDDDADYPSTRAAALAASREFYRRQAEQRGEGDG